MSDAFSARPADASSFLIKMRTILKSKPRSWIKVFLAEDGLTRIVSLLNDTIRNLNEKAVDSEAVEIIAECVRSIKAIMNADVRLLAPLSLPRLLTRAR